MPLNVTFDYNFNEVQPEVEGDTNLVKLTSYRPNHHRRFSTPPKDCSAVEVRRLKYTVGRARKPKAILSGINMTVPEGAIYGLLGPSGSGKTTLLRTVVGQLKPTEGYVKVFGFQPNQPGSQIPGPAIGYMPQEIAVYNDFTIEETLVYFGRLYRIKWKILEERISFLLTFLDLPHKQRLITNLSGGQKRRVSLASALVHSPPLLILDEPTVGVDPLLRQSIWQHLVTLTQTEKITVIVTTHYIEEARRANIVGLMRRGKLLAENSPDDLMARHDSISLEDVFLKLCVSDTMRRAQKFANLTGLPVQAAMAGQNSVLPTPEIESKRKHHEHHQNHIELGNQDQSHFGHHHSMNMNLNVNLGHHQHQQEQKQQNNSSCEGPVERGNEGGGQATMIEMSSAASTSSQHSATDQTATPTNAEIMDEHHNQTVIDMQKKQHQHQAEDGDQNSGSSNASPFPEQQNQQQQHVSGSKFAFKSILKGFGNNNSNKCHKVNGTTDDRMDDTGSNKKAIEARRQSGTYFMEQYLKSKFQPQQTAGIFPMALQGGQINLGNTISCESLKSVASKLDMTNMIIDNNNSCSNNNNNNDNGNKQLALPKINIYQPPVSPTATELSDGGHYQSSQLSAAADQTSRTNIDNNHQRHYDDEDLNIDPELFINPYELSTMSPGSKYDYKKPSVKEYCDSIRTVTWKNYIRLKRNVPLLLFQFLLPSIQVILFCICVGNDPFDVKVAVVNEESSADSVAALSTQFLHLVDSRLVKQVPYNNLDEAIESVRRGQNWGAIHIPENFTISIHKRFTGIEGEVDNDTINNSTIKVYPDMTNQPISYAMEVAFRQAFSELTKKTFEFIGLNPSLSDPPIRMDQAIYGELNMKNYLQYMAPGVIISISYIMATGLTALAFIIEKRDGLYDRTLAAGVNQVQILVSHSIIQLTVMTVQISLVVFFTFVIYKVPTKGPFVWVFLLLLLQGLTGMSFGLLVSAVCEEENTAMMMILGTFYPNLLLAGVIWPIEAIPLWLRWFSYLQPQTIPTEALRNLIVRGWNITETGVWAGFAVTSTWLLFFLIMASIAFRAKK